MKPLDPAAFPQRCVVGRGAWFVVFAALGFGLLQAAVPLHGQASQQGRNLQPTEDLLRRPTSIEPASGPPGTRVVVKGSDFPAITPINIGFGGTRSGFEGLAFVLTSREGGVDESVEVPEWANHTRIHRFIIFDAYFEPIAMTELFHVTDARGRILREGTVGRASAGCTWVTGQDQEEYVLVDLREPIQEGRWLAFEGRITDSGVCGNAVHVTEVVFPSEG